ncbi:MAG: hypothetical protein ABF254_13455 [Octadecabacter sp.]
MDYTKANLVTGKTKISRNKIGKAGGNRTQRREGRQKLAKIGLKSSKDFIAKSFKDFGR